MFLLQFLFMRFCTVKQVYSGHAIDRTPGNRGHFFNEPAESRKNIHVIIQHMSLLEHESYYLIFPSYFYPCYNLHLHKKYFTGILSSNPTPRLNLFPVTPTRM